MIGRDNKGQAAILYALMIPILFFAGGVGLDLGWYYLNVSRLQNAADASVLAGGKVLLGEINYNQKKTLKDLGYKVKLVYSYPSNKPDTTGIDITAGDKVALAYAKKNLAASSLSQWLFSVAEAEDDNISYTLRDGYTRGDPTVTLTPGLYIDGEDYYYVISFEENIHHFFIGFLDDMHAGVVAVALISKNINNGTSIDDPVKVTFDPNGGSFTDGTKDPVENSFKNPAYLKDDEDPDILTSGKDGNPTYTDSLGNDKAFAGWSYVNPDDIDVEKGENASDYFVEEGTPLTEELLATIQEHGGVLYAVYIRNNKTLWEQMQYLIAKNVYDQQWVVSTKKYGYGELYHNSFRDPDQTYAADSKYHYYTEQINMNEYDEQQYWAKPAYRKIGEQTQYFIDFCRSSTLNGGNLSIMPDYGFNYNSNPGSRIHSLLNVNTLYEVRDEYKGKSDDPLYCRFEAEPVNTEGGGNRATPIRQIVININVDNTDDKYRPLFFFYDGPITGSTDAKPVILNLNADFKGVLFMPDIPVVINGNDHTFEGFIIAKEFRYLTTSGTRVKYSIKGETDKAYSNNDIRIDKSTGEVNSKVVTTKDALSMWNTNGTGKFGLNANSKFRRFTTDTGVTYLYAFYDTNLILDEKPFHEYWDTSRALIPLYNETGTLLTSWSNVRLYNSADKSNRIEIPKQITESNISVINALSGTSYTKTSDYIRTVILDSEGNPAQIYDAAGNPIYFCDDYVNLTGSYTVFTLDRVEDGTRDPKEFLLTADTAHVSADSNISDTDDWK